MKIKPKQETERPASSLRRLPTGDISNNLDGQDKKVSKKAVESVAGQYGINSTIFTEWLEMKGFQILEEA